MSAKSIRELLTLAQNWLCETSPSPQIDAEALLSHALQKPRSYLYAWPERVPDTLSTNHFAKLLERRVAGEPVAYLVGWREFWSLPLKVTPDTLIPRPETELLVELTLKRIAPGDSVVDLGTGSGAVALAIAYEKPQVRLIATDINAAALSLAKHNAQQLGLHNIEFRLGNWYTALRQERHSAIVSNPPYLAFDDPHLRQGDLRFEPTAALIADTHGLAAIQQIIAQANQYLMPGGHLLLEHGYGQSATVLSLLQKAGFTECFDYSDNAGIGRVSCGVWSS